MATRLNREVTAPDLYRHYSTGQMANKMTSEISSAIRRRNETTGVDYWRSGLQTIGQLSALPIQDRRPSFNRLTHINLDFPGVFAPNLAPKLKPKRKEVSSTSTVVVTRNRPTIITGFNANGLQSSKGTDGNNNNMAPKRATVTDLTCMQLADTLFSSSNHSYSGVLNFGPGKLRYSDYFDETDSQYPDNDNYTAIKYRDGRGKAQALKYQTFQAEDILPYSGGSSNRGSPVSPREREIMIQVETPREEKPQKSILKNADKMNGETVPGFGRSSSSYVLPLATRTNVSPKFGATKEHGTVVAIQTGPKTAIRNDIGPLHGYAVAKMYPSDSLESVKKRSVRFKNANEIREYTPSEPVCS